MADEKNANGTLSSIKNGIGDLLHLQVLTVVGDFELTTNQGGNFDLDFASVQAGKKMFTRIGLVDGDISTAMSDDFVTNEAYSDLRSFHQDTVAQGNEIVRNNVQALKELVSLLKNELGAEDKTS